MIKTLTEQELEESKRKFFDTQPPKGKLTGEEKKLIEENLKIGPVGKPQTLDEALKSIWEK